MSNTKRKVDLPWEVKQLAAFGSSKELGATSYKVEGRRHIVVDRADLLDHPRSRVVNEIELEFGLAEKVSTERYDKGLGGYRWRLVFPAAAKKPKSMPYWTLKYHTNTDSATQSYQTLAPNREKVVELFRATVHAKDSVITDVRRTPTAIRFATLVKRYGKPTWYESILPPDDAVIGKWGNTMFLISSDCGGADYGRLGYALANRYSVCTFPKPFTKEDMDIPVVTGIYFEDGDTP